MSAKLFAGMLAAGAVYASPVTPNEKRSGDDLFKRGITCSQVTSYISKIKANAVATPFCSSLLHIPTTTTTLTVTKSPSPCLTTVTTTVSSGTSTVLTTSVSYGVTTDYPVVARSPTSTCGLGQTVIPSDSAAATATSPAKLKRTNNNQAPPPGQPCTKKTTTALGTPTCFKGVPEVTLSSACSCLSIPTPSTVAFTTTTLPIKTITKTVVGKPAATVVSTVITTSWTSTYHATQYYDSTFTVLPNPTSVVTPSAYTSTATDAQATFIPDTPNTDGESFGAYDGLDFAGNDIPGQSFYCYTQDPNGAPKGSVPSPYPDCNNFNDCISECAFYNDNLKGTGQPCGAVVYNGPADGSSSAYCYLKYNVTGCGSPDTNHHTGVLLPLVPNDVQ